MLRSSGLGVAMTLPVCPNSMTDREALLSNENVHVTEQVQMIRRAKIYCNELFSAHEAAKWGLTKWGSSDASASDDSPVVFEAKPCQRQLLTEVASCRFLSLFVALCVTPGFVTRVHA